MSDQSKMLLELTAKLVAAYVSNNPVPSSSLPDLIGRVSDSLRGAVDGPVTETPARVPAVNPKKSVFPDYIICLEDGTKFKALKRPLMSRYGLTPEEYRERWNLPDDYPMVAPTHSAARSATAKRTGLGRKVRDAPSRARRDASKRT
jgi:predicted transcriptional regulator